MGEPRLDDALGARAPLVVRPTRGTSVGSSESAAEPPVHDGSPLRIRRVVEAHYAFVWRSLRGLGVPAASADDAAQHVFLVAAQKMTAIAEGAERAFLFGTVTGVAANMRRSQNLRRDREIVDDGALATAPDPSRAPDAELERREQCAVLEAILEAMPDDLRVVFVLFELEGLTSIEIAEVLAVPTGTVASRLRRAREDFQARVARRGAAR